MKRVACPLCRTMVPHRDYPGILINAIATAGHNVVTHREALARLGSSDEDKALRKGCEARLKTAEETLAELLRFRDLPEDSEARLP